MNTVCFTVCLFCSFLSTFHLAGPLLEQCPGCFAWELVILSPSHFAPCHLGTFASLLIAKTQIQLLIIVEVAVSPSLFELLVRSRTQMSLVLAAAISFCGFVMLLVGEIHLSLLLSH